MSFQSAFEKHKSQTAEIMAEVHSTEEEWLAESIEADYDFRLFGSETEEAVDTFERRIGFALPAELRAFYLSHGGFSIFDEWKYLGIRVPTVTELLREPGQFSSLNRAWPFLYGGLATYGTPEEFDSLPQQHLRVMKSDLVIFGQVNHSFGHGDTTFLTFSRHGHIFQLPYDHDCEGKEWRDRYQPIGQLNIESRPLDSLLESHISASTQELERRLAEGDW